MINIIEVPSSLLFTETLALELINHPPYLYIDMSIAGKLAMRYKDSYDFWAKFLQDLIEQLNANRVSKIIFDNVNQEISQMIDSNNLQTFSVDR